MMQWLRLQPVLERGAMSPTINVIRAIADNNRQQAVETCVASHRLGTADPRLFNAKSKTFSLLPDAPFVYWAKCGDSVGKPAVLPSFCSAAQVRSAFERETIFVSSALYGKSRVAALHREFRGCRQRSRSGTIQMGTARALVVHRSHGFRQYWSQSIGKITVMNSVNTLLNMAPRRG